MASILRWITASDDRPTSETTSSSGSQGSALVTRRDPDRPLSVSRSAAGPHSVTYASKDDQKGVQFVCHLPAGSQHAAQAQRIAGAVFSRRRGDAGDMLLSGTGSNSRLLEDDRRRERRETEEREPRGSNGRLEDPEIVTVRPNSVDGRSTRDTPSEVRGMPQDTSSRRGTSEAGTTDYMSSRGSTMGEVLEDARYSGRRNDDFETMSVGSRAYDMESVASVPISRTSVNSSKKATGTPAGFRHQSNTHVTYNIKNNDGKRQLFVSAPTGSREADMHDQVAARAATTAAAGRVQYRDSESNERRRIRRD